jgi:hypothetical protein
MWQDKINGLFELTGGLFILLHCIKLYKDKKVRGVSFVATGYFVLWGYWNIYYYPFLEQWASFIGGLTIVVMNSVWIGMMIYYMKREKRRL